MRKRIKGIICGVLSTTLLTVGAYAANYSAAYSRENNSIKMESKIEEGSRGVFVYILKGKLAEDEKVSDVISKDTLVYADVMKDEFSFPNTADDGVYTVVFAGNAADIREYVLKNTRETEQEGVSEVFRAQNAQDMLEKLLANNNSAYILDLSNANDISELLYDVVRVLGLNQKSDPNAEDLNHAYSTAEDLFKMRTADADELAKLLVAKKEILGLDENIEKYSSAVAEGIIKAKEKGKAFDKFDEQKRLSYECLALAALNHAGSSNLYNTIEKYNDVFNVTFSAKKESVSEYEVSKLITTEFDDVTKVGSIVNDAIETAYKNKNKNSGDSSSGGNSGGGRGYSAPSLIDREKLAESVGDSTEYTDINEYDWAIDAIKYLSKKNIMCGDGDGKFRPGDMITREELVKIVVEALGKGKIESAQLSFEDVKDEWYKQYIETAYSNGIITGVDNKTFGIGNAVTREDACVILNRAAEAYYKTFNKKETLVDIPDSDLIAEYAKISVDTLVRAGIVVGFEDGTFRPKENVTRAQAAKVIYNCLTNLDS